MNPISSFRFIANIKKSLFFIFDLTDVFSKVKKKKKKLFIFVTKYFFEFLSKLNFKENNRLEFFTLKNLGKITAAKDRIF